MHPSPDVLALLALGEEAGTPAEREHVADCAQCQAEVSEMARAVTAGRSGGGESGLVTPPDRVWAAIRAELGFGAPPAELDGAAYGAHGLPELAPATARPRHARAESNGAAAAEPAPVVPLDQARSRSSRGRRFGALLVAAAVALVLGVGLGLGLDRLLGPRETVLWTAQLQALPAFAGSSGQATVEQDSKGNRTLVIKIESPEPVEGSREVWLANRDLTTMRPLGLLVGGSGRYALSTDVDPQRLPVVDVSKEPPGDPDPQHSTVSIVRGTLNV